MIFPRPLEKVKILKRYKRFFADVLRANGETLTVHVPNTGPMLGAWEIGWDCYIMPKEKVNKLSHGVEMTQNPEGILMGVNTQNPNRLMREAFQNRQIPMVQEYSQVVPEFTIGKSKLDFKLMGDGLPDCFIEIKNCSGKDQQGAFFPDTRSDRAVKHVEELMTLKKQGYRTILIFIIQRGDVETFRPGDEFHPEYGKILRQAIKEGLEVYPFRCNLSLTGITLGEILKMKL